jgi:hypothetical protein
LKTLSHTYLSQFLVYARRAFEAYDSALFYLHKEGPLPTDDEDFQLKCSDAQIALTQVVSIGRHLMELTYGDGHLQFESNLIGISVLSVVASCEAALIQLKKRPRGMPEIPPVLAELVSFAATSHNAFWKGMTFPTAKKTA